MGDGVINNLTDLFRKIIQTTVEVGGEGSAKYRKLTPKEIDEALMKLADRFNEEISVEVHYFTSKADLKGHEFKLKDGTIVTTNFGDANTEGSVAFLDPERSRLEGGGNNLLKG